MVSARLSCVWHVELAFTSRECCEKDNREGRLMELEVLNFLSAGGDVATIALVYAMWKFDRRLFALELDKQKVKKS